MRLKSMHAWAWARSFGAENLLMMPAVADNSLITLQSGLVARPVL
jgi:hypothetical protein